MIYNTRNRSNDTAESQKEKKTCFNAHAQYNQSKNYRAKITYTFQYCVCEHEEEF